MRNIARYRTATPDIASADDETPIPPCSENPGLWDDRIDIGLGRYEDNAVRARRHALAAAICRTQCQLLATTGCPVPEGAGGVIAGVVPK